MDIWEELQDRAQHGGSIGRTVASVAERTSKNVGASEPDAGGLFDETASWYARLRDRSEQIITETLVSNVRVALKPYRHM